MAVLFSASGTPREGAVNINGMRSTFPARQIQFALKLMF
jgi:hypothetical protein